MALLLITIDTNIVDPKEVAPLEAVLTDIPHEIGFVSVTEREHGYEIGYLGRRVTESGVWGESPWGSSNWSGPKPAQFVVGESTVAPGGAIPGHYDVVAGDGSLLESALTIISAGSFPKIGQRENLTSNVRRQLRERDDFRSPCPCRPTRPRKQRCQGVREGRSAGSTRGARAYQDPHPGGIHGRGCERPN